MAAEVVSVADSTIIASDISQEIIYRDYGSQTSVKFNGAERCSIDFPLSQIGITGYTMIGAQLILINGTGGANVVNCFTRLYADGHVSQYIRNTVSSAVGPITVNIRVFYRRNS